MTDEPATAYNGSAAAAPGGRDAAGYWSAAREWLLRTGAERLPQRVLRELDEQRRRNEILTGWIQAALVLVFALLYAFSRKTSPMDALFEPVPWALAAYAGFTGWRLLLAYRGTLTHAVLMTSVVADMAVLMITIWSFHIQYEQPAAFYLKAPTLLYVFIFIALRVLSIVPGYVLFAGLCAAASWLALVAYALAASGGMELVTRDYVAYMTSARVLIGGEVDKVVSILLVTVVLTVATARARTLFHRSVAGSAAAAQLSRFFAPEVAATIVGADEALAPGTGRQVAAAAMFLDLRGFTRLAARLAPDRLLDLLREYQRIAVTTIQRHGGSIDGYLGDGILATFGATRASTTYAADAMRATDELLNELEKWEERRRREGLPAPSVGIGVASGPLTCGAIGDESRLEFTVIGDAVNTAAKLQNHTKVEQVRALAAAATFVLARNQGYAVQGGPRLLPDRQVAGLEQPADVIVLG